jgi:aspartate aminotransferase-like enzyme
MPDGWTWSEFDRALRKHGVLVGGSYGDLTDRVFRIGHMGDIQCSS